MKLEKLYIKMFSQIASVILLCSFCGMAYSFEIPTESEDTKIRWDNSIRYNYGVRVGNPDEAIINNPNMDDGDRNFDKGTITSRVDILSEFDIVYKDRYGARISAAAWYDQRYHDPLGNDSVATSNHIENGNQALGLSNYTERINAGPDGELLDAFVFGGLDLGSVPVNLKLGRHTVYWGESLMFGGVLNGIAYSQMSLDAYKASASPGAAANELFRPLFSASAQTQLNKELSIAGQYFFEWEPIRLAEAGSYWSNADYVLHGGETIILAPGTLFTHGDDIEPSEKGHGGVSLRWSPVWLGGSIGLYYRRYADIIPQACLDMATGEYFAVYGDDVDLYGISLSKNILGVSVGTEFSYRHNTPMLSDVVALTAGTPRPDQGETYGARGDTLHGVLNFMGFVSKTPLFDMANWALEFTWIRWNRVTQGEQYFLGRDGYNHINRVTKDAVGMGASFSPTWFAVFPSMDLSMPIGLSMGLIGNSACDSVSSENAGSWSVGLSLDVYQKYTFTLQYIDIFGDYDTDSTGAVSYQRGSQATLRDRDLIAFTFKFSF